MIKHAPKNLDELTQLYSDIVCGKSNLRLGPRTANLLKQMLDDPSGTSVKTVLELAGEYGVNNSSVTRLAQKLGFPGFPGLQAIFRQELKHRNHFYSQQVDKFLKKAPSDVGSEDTILHHVMQNEWGNAMITLENFDLAKFQSAIDLLIAAEKIAVLGLRSSYSLSYYFGYYLKMIRGGVSILGNSGHTIAEDIADLNPDDLFVAIGVKPYTKDTVVACRIARSIQVQTVVITDSPTSPLVTELPHFLLTSTRGDSFFSPAISSFLLIEAILSELVKRLGKNAIEKLRVKENVLEMMDTETE